MGSRPGTGPFSTGAAPRHGRPAAGSVGMKGLGHDPSFGGSTADIRKELLWYFQPKDAQEFRQIGQGGWKGRNLPSTDDGVYGWVKRYDVLGNKARSDRRGLQNRIQRVIEDSASRGFAALSATTTGSETVNDILIPRHPSSWKAAI